MIERMPPPSRRRRGDLAIGGVPFGSFLGETKSAQPRRFDGFDLLRILVGELRFHMYVFCHHGNGTVLWGGIYDVGKIAIGQRQVCACKRSLREAPPRPGGYMGRRGRICTG
jgi:hypothetical protein